MSKYNKSRKPKRAKKTKPKKPQTRSYQYKNSGYNDHHWLFPDSLWSGTSDYKRLREMCVLRIYAPLHDSLHYHCPIIPPIPNHWTCYVITHFTATDHHVLASMDELIRVVQEKAELEARRRYDEIEQEMAKLFIKALEKQRYFLKKRGFRR